MFKNLTKLFSSKVSIPDQALILDVRSPVEFADGHIKGARNIPVDVLQSNVSSLSSYKQENVVIYCRSGARADMAEIVLRQSNFTKIINAGSISRINEANIVAA